MSQLHGEHTENDNSPITIYGQVPSHHVNQRNQDNLGRMETEDEEAERRRPNSPNSQTHSTFRFVFNPDINSRPTVIMAPRSMDEIQIVHDERRDLARIQTTYHSMDEVQVSFEEGDPVNEIIDLEEYLSNFDDSASVVETPSTSLAVSSTDASADGEADERLARTRDYCKELEEIIATNGQDLSALNTSLQALMKRINLTLNGTERSIDDECDDMLSTYTTSLRTCDICCQTKPISRFLHSLSCSHVFCEDCIFNHHIRRQAYPMVYLREVQCMTCRVYGNNYVRFTPVGNRTNISIVSRPEHILT